MFVTLKDLQTPVLVLPMMKTWVRKTSQTRQNLSLRTPPMVATVLQLNIVECLWLVANFPSPLGSLSRHQPVSSPHVVSDGLRVVHAAPQLPTVQRGLAQGGVGEDLAQRGAR